MNECALDADAGSKGDTMEDEGMQLTSLQAILLASYLSLILMMHLTSCSTQACIPLLKIVMIMMVMMK